MLQLSAQTSYAHIREVTHTQKYGTRNLHQIEHRSIRCKFLLSETFKTRPNNQTTQFWCKKTCASLWYQILQLVVTPLNKIHRVPEKTSHFNFCHNFAICWDIFTIFEAPCSGLISGWCRLLHTHHRCEAFTWHDVTHDVCQTVARNA